MAMISQVHTQNQKTKKEPQDFSNTPVQGMFQSQPFVMQAKTANKEQQPDFKASLMRAEKYGHRLNQIDSTNQSSLTALQLKMGTGQPIQCGKGKNKSQEIGGASLSWQPKRAGKFIRYASKEEAEGNESRNRAAWFFDSNQEYNADFASGREYIFTLNVDFDQCVSPSNKEFLFINFESEDFKGEAQHKDKIIVKENERGAYGIGQNLYSLAKQNGEFTKTENKNKNKNKKK
ncbi:hypothetical protein [Calothrix sp. CCY 0018]|uniref:hypothetical protein n=1 Tax=Calothrix sp. CCY 0018 TaxID=3103864 RepID=UPI0039C6FC18